MNKDDMDRRSFIKIGGSLVAAGMTGACGQMAQKIIPYVTPADEGIDPVDGIHYNTACRMCGAGCGITVRTVLGRAKKIEGNIHHPLNHGGVCARGQAAVQQLYHPERVQTPLLRTGAKGTNSFRPAGWDEVLKILGEKMKVSGGDTYVIAAEGSDIAAAIAARMMARCKSDDFAVTEIQGWGGEARVAPGGVKAGAVPVYDIANAGCVLLLGADIFEDGVSPVHYGWAYGEMRRGKPAKRGMMVYAGPRVSMTAASADHFIGVRKGMLGIFALGVAAETLALVSEGKGNSSLRSPAVKAFKNGLGPVTAEKASQISGVPAETFRRVAEELVKNGPSVAIPGDELFLHSNGAEAAEGVDLLNAVLRAANGGKALVHEPLESDIVLYRKMKEFIGVPEAAARYSSTQRLLAKAADGKMKLGIIIGANPVHELPGALNSAQALEKTGFVGVCGCFLNDTTRYADLVLPDNHFLESWSVQICGAMPGVPVLNAQQPVVSPLYGTMQAGDAILKASAIAGMDLGIQSQEALVEKMIGAFQAGLRGIPSSLNAKNAWEYMLQRGGWWPDDGGGEEKPVLRETNTWSKPGVINAATPVFAGGAEYPFHFHPYHTVNIGYGNGANLGWLMEMPEPMTTLSWGSWIEINPKTAKQLGVEDGDVLKVESPFGSIEAPAHLYPGIDTETVAAPFGFGHGSFGKYASNRGANAMKLIGEFPVRGAEVPAWRGIKVKLVKTGKKVEMVREGNPRGDYEGEVFQL